jgi:peptidoglycan/LPS O-acetylase OafA/YrhL
MVLGHTVDALLATAGRADPAVVVYWKARGLTAPLFLVASGWAVTSAILRSGLRGADVARARLPRVLLLLVIGYGLRWPGWAGAALGAGDPATWSHLLAFDALHTIAVCLLLAGLLLALPLDARERGAAFALLVVVAIALGLRGPAPLPVAPGQLPGPVLAMALAQAAGGTSPFPLFPWIAFFFAGAIVALLVQAGARRAFATIAIVGAALVLATFWTGVGTMPAGHPALVAFRIGAVLLILAAMSALPASLGARLSPLGRASLGVYVIHVPVVYGWSVHEGLAQRIGPSLPLGEAVLAGVVVLCGSYALHRGAAAGLRATLVAAREALRRVSAA